MAALPGGHSQPGPQHRILSIAPYHSDTLDADRAAASAELDAALQGRPYTLGEQLDRVPAEIRNQIFRIVLKSEVYKVGDVSCRKFGTTPVLMKVNCSLRYEVGKMFQQKIVYHYHHDLAARSKASMPRIVAEYHHVPQARQDAIIGVVVTVHCSHKVTLQGVAGFAQVMAMVPFFRQVWHIQFEQTSEQVTRTVAARSAKMTWCYIMSTDRSHYDRYSFSSFQNLLQSLIRMPRIQETTRSHSQLKWAECIKRRTFRLILDLGLPFSSASSLSFVEAVAFEWRQTLFADDDGWKDLLCDWLHDRQMDGGVSAEGPIPG